MCQSSATWVISTYSLMKFSQHIMALFGRQAFQIRTTQGTFEQLSIDKGKSSRLDLHLVGLILLSREFSRAYVVSRPRSRSDPIGESEPVSGCETIYWDFFFFSDSLSFSCSYHFPVSCLLQVVTHIYYMYDRSNHIQNKLIRIQ